MFPALAPSWGCGKFREWRSILRCNEGHTAGNIIGQLSCHDASFKPSSCCVLVCAALCNAGKVEYYQCNAGKVEFYQQEGKPPAGEATSNRMRVAGALEVRASLRCTRHSHRPLLRLGAPHDLGEGRHHACGAPPLLVGYEGRADVTCRPGKLLTS
jgi:hypothetical protein